MNQIPERLDRVRDRIRKAAIASGRDPATITLLAVSKTKPAGDVLAAFAAGQRCFGENYLQDALPKINALAGHDIEWHFIGRIQGDKTTEISRHFAWVHSLDNPRHAELLARHRENNDTPLQVCLQVNLSGESSKGGVAADDLPSLARAVSALPGLRLRGLMTMPDPNADQSQQRAVFASLRELLEQLNSDSMHLDTLSMGMSGDLELAIAEGANLVRIGTDIFGTRS